MCHDLRVLDALLGHVCSLAGVRLLRHLSDDNSLGSHLDNLFECLRPAPHDILAPPDGRQLCSIATMVMLTLRDPVIEVLCVAGRAASVLQLGYDRCAIPTRSIPAHCLKLRCSGQHVSAVNSVGKVPLKRMPNSSLVNT